MNIEAYNLFIQAKLGNDSSQSKFLKYLNDLTNTIRKQHQSFFDEKFGKNSNTFDTILLECLKSVLLREKIYGYDEFDNMFKYIYIQNLKYYMRIAFNNYEFNSRCEDSLNEKINNDFIGDNSYMGREYTCPDEIVTTIFHDPASKIKKSEIIVLDLYLKDYSVTEISRILNKTYVCIYRKLDKALVKCKKYISENFSEYC